jgi:hypothetical protein
MRGFVADIEDMTEQNSYFRRVLYTGKQLQLVLMSLAPGEDIGGEVIPTTTSSSGSRKATAKSGSTATRPRSKATSRSSCLQARGTTSRTPVINR